MTGAFPMPGHARSGFLFPAGDSLRIPDRLKKKIDRFARLVFRAGKRRCT
jgi:hypothetical protein